jgi:hypothetical protein
VTNRSLLNALDVIVPLVLLAVMFGGAHLLGYDLPAAMRGVLDLAH